MKTALSWKIYIVLICCLLHAILLVAKDWQLVKNRISQHQTRVEQQFRDDPAGNFPAEIVSMFLVAGPVNTLSRLKKFDSGQ